MQDNYDKAFEDRAWADMRRRLDASMPVHPPRGSSRRWAWLLLLLLPLGIGLYFATASRQTEMAAGADVRNVPQGAADPGPDRIVSEKGPAPQDAPSAVSQTTPLASPETLAATRTEPDGTLIAPAPSNSGQEWPILSVEAPRLPVSVRLADRQIVSDQAEISHLFDMPERASATFGLQASLEALIPLEGALAKDLDHPSAWQREQLEVPSLPRRPSWLPDNWGVRGGMLFSNGLALSGGRTEGFAEYRIGRRWAVQFGGGYRYVKQGFDRQKNVNLDMAEAMDPNNNLDNSFGLAASQAVITNHLVDRHVLYFPLNVSFRITPRFEITSGAQVLYTLAARTRSGSSYPLSGSNSIQADAYTRAFLAASSGGTIRDEILRNLDFGLDLRAAFRLNARLAVELEYTYGLNDLVPSDRVQLYNRFLEAGLSWRF